MEAEASDIRERSGAQVSPGIEILHDPHLTPPTYRYGEIYGAAREILSTHVRPINHFILFLLYSSITSFEKPA